MALQLFDRVQVTATANTTVSFTLGSAVTGYQSFSVMTNGNTTYYGASDGTNWEVGIGTYSTSGPTLTRTTILSSSNSGSAVTFSGTPNVWIDYPSSKSVTSTGALTSGRVSYATTDGALNDSANLQFTGSNLLIGQTYDQGTGALQVTGTSTQNGNVVDKQLYLQGGNNIVTYSQDFDNAAWAGVTGGVTVVANNATAPDGTTTADTATFTGSSYRYQIVNTGVVTNKTYTCSVWISSLTGKNTIGVRIAGATTSADSVFSLVTLTSTPTRVSITRTFTSTDTQLIVGFDNRTSVVGGSQTTGDVIVWGAQLELGSVASSYTPTTTAAITTTNNISVPSGQVLGANGTVSLPSLSVGQANTGLYAISSTQLGISQSGSMQGYYTNGTYWAYGNLGTLNTGSIYWNSGDTILARDAANILAQRNGTNAQTLRVYNTYTDVSNYERLTIAARASDSFIGYEVAGTGNYRNLLINGSQLVFQTQATNRWILSSTSISPAADASYDLGTASTGRVRNGYFSGVVTTNADASINTLTVGLGGGAVSSNLTVGQSGLVNNSTGGQNTAIGSSSLQSNKTGNQNTALGFQSLLYNVSGGANTALGMYSLFNNTTASNLTAVGYQALNQNTTNVATLGTVTGGTGYTNGTYTGVVMTLSSGSTMTTYPTATIVVAGGVVTTVTLTSNGVGAKDTTTVLTAPAASIGGTGSGFSVPVASLASGAGNTAVGFQALYNNTTASNNAALGTSALTANTTGASNSAFGNSALIDNNAGANNTSIGFNALARNTTGNNNTGLGRQSGVGNASANANTTGSNNVYIGYQSVGSANNNSNEIVIGATATGLGSNTAVIGNSSTTLTKAFGVVTSTVYTVATLPSASTSGIGARAFVSDALAPTFGSTVVTGGAVAVPVYSDGTNWKVG